MRDIAGSAAAPRGQMEKISAGKFHFEPPSRFTSLDHLVGATRQRKRDSDAERLGGLETEDQLDFRGKLHDRDVSRLLAFENAPGVDAAQTICVRSIASVAHQTTSGGKLSKLVDRWNAVAEGECAELRGVAAEHRVGGADHECGCSQLRYCCESRFEVGFRARVEYMKLHTEFIGYGLEVFRQRRSEWTCQVEEQSKGRRPGEQLTREFEPLRPDFDA